MSSLPSPYLTPEEYLALDRQAEEKSEYFAGEMFATAGGTLNHALIGASLLSALDRQLGEGPCVAIGSEVRVLVDATGLYTYPDVTIVCGEPQLLDSYQDVLTNPKVIVEVLSSSTESYDRGKKWEHYQQIPSLDAYLLVSQDRPRIEVFTRISGSGEWRYTSHAGLDAVVELPALGCRLALAGVYRRVRFEATGTEPVSPQPGDPA